MGNEEYRSAEIDILLFASDVNTDVVSESDTPGIDLPDD
jgi:hypothetical protein